MIKIKKKEFQKLYNIACTTWKPKFDEKFKNFLFEDYIEFDESFLKQMESACTADQLKVFKVIFKEYLKKELDLFSFDTYSKICKELKEKEYTLKDFDFLPEEYREKQLVFSQIKQIEKFFNQEWKADFKNSSQYKYYPYFEFETSGGLRFVRSVSYGQSFHVQVFFYKSEGISNFVGKTFIDIYKKLV